MATFKSAVIENEISRDRLAELLKEDLAREYQAIIGYVVYSQVLKGAEYMDIASQLENHAKQEPRPRPHDLAADRLSGANASSYSQACTHLERFERDAPLRSGE